MTHDEIFELFVKHHYKWNEAKNFLDQHTGKDGKISVDDAKIVDKMIEEVDTMRKTLDYELQQPANHTQTLIKPLPMTFDDYVATYNNTYTLAGVSDSAYLRNFINEIRHKFKTATNSLREGDPALGGYLVPSQFHEEIITTLAEENVMRQIGRVITTQSTYEIPIQSVRPSANWIHEGGNIELSDGSFERKTLGAYKIAAGVSVSNELLADSYYNIEQHLQIEFGKTL